MPARARACSVADCWCLCGAWRRRAGVRYERAGCAGGHVHREFREVVRSDEAAVVRGAACRWAGCAHAPPRLGFGSQLRQTYASASHPHCSSVHRQASPAHPRPRLRVHRALGCCVADSLCPRLIAPAPHACGGYSLTARRHEQGILGASVPVAKFKPDAIDVMRVMAAEQAKEGLDASDPQRSSMWTTWGRIAVALKAEFAPCVALHATAPQTRTPRAQQVRSHDGVAGHSLTPAQVPERCHAVAAGGCGGEPAGEAGAACTDHGRGG